MNSPPLNALKMTLKYQIIIALSFLVVFVVFVKLTAPTVILERVISYLLGACIFAVSNAYYTVYALRYFLSPNTQPKDTRSQNNNHSNSAPLVLSFINKGQKGKFVLSAVFFALVFSLFDMLREPANVLALFLGYWILIFAQWLIAKKIIDKVLP